LTVQQDLCLAAGVYNCTVDGIMQIYVCI